jgi:hypothetical protein
MISSDPFGIFRPSPTGIETNDGKLIIVSFSPKTDSFFWELQRINGMSTIFSKTKLPSGRIAPIVQYFGTSKQLYNDMYIFSKGDTSIFNWPPKII